MAIVKLYANLRKLAGTRELTVAGANLEAVLNDLVRQHQALGEALLRNGELRPHVIVTLNGQILVGLDAPTTEQDVIAIFPPIAGGSVFPIPRRSGEGVLGEDDGWLVSEHIGY